MTTNPFHDTTLSPDRGASIASPTDLKAHASPLLIIGAAHTGKSELGAQALDEGRPALVIGTGSAVDEEMSLRIKELREARPSSWKTIEQPQDLVETLKAHIAPYPQVLIDSLNQWIADLVVRGHQKYSGEQLDDHINQELKALFQVMTQNPKKRFVIVSSEIGAGTPPPKQVARYYRRAVSRANCRCAQFCTGVIMVSCGIPLPIKS